MIVNLHAAKTNEKRKKYYLISRNIEKTERTKENRMTFAREVNAIFFLNSTSLKMYERCIICLKTSRKHGGNVGR